jgi:nitrate reductase gamma subunit
MSRWFWTSKANTLFFYSAWVVVYMGVFMIFMLTPWFQQIEALPKGETLLRILGGILGVVGAPASLVILFGMAAFCFREDRSSIGTKTFWFILFFTTACFGAAAYFFGVHRKQVAAGSPLHTPN